MPHKRKYPGLARGVLAAGLCIAGFAWHGAIQAQQSAAVEREWIRPGQDGMLPAQVEYTNPLGKIGILNMAGPINMKGHPFFEPLGTNGRACVTCHQPSDAMGLSLDSIRQQWRVTNGRDPLFAMFDGANCPNLPPEDEASHSLLLNHGLIRIPLSWPPRAADGSTITPEFDIEVVRDPTGCNTHPVYGIEGEMKQVSVYRRPRMAANLEHIVFPTGPFNAKRLAMVNDRDPFSGNHMSMNMMADAREPSLRTQASNAILGHLQAQSAPSMEVLDKIVAFEEQVYAAQRVSNGAGLLEYPGGPEALGPMTMERTNRGLGDNFNTPLFMHFDMWRSPNNAETREQAEFRASVARGYDVFFLRPFMIADTSHINTVGLGNPVKRSCATCHNAVLVGTDASAGWVDVGTTNLPWAREVPVYPWSEEEHQLPLFKITCHDEARPHPFLGRVIYTQDPGRALISGRCVDVGSIVMGQFRGLAARAPYFSNGSAASLRDLVDFYDRRFNIGFTEQEKVDLTNFLSVL
jgi:hypothetical protein